MPGAKVSAAMPDIDLNGNLYIQTVPWLVLHLQSSIFISHHAIYFLPNLQDARSVYCGLSENAEQWWYMGVSCITEKNNITHIALDTWWSHDRETFPILLPICEGNPPVTGELFITTFWSKCRNLVTLCMFFYRIAFGINGVYMLTQCALYGLFSHLECTLQVIVLRVD